MRERGEGRGEWGEGIMEFGFGRRGREEREGACGGSGRLERKHKN